MTGMQSRKSQIRHLMKKKGTAQVTELASLLKVSDMTIRRDLSELEKEGFLRRTHGGAIREVSRGFELPFMQRESKNRELKNQIALRAADLIEEGDTIALDTGTTVLELAKILTRFSRLTIVTASLQVALLFVEHPDIQLILPGGKIRMGEGSLVGEITLSNLEGLYFDKFFMSTGCLDSQAGFTDYVSEDGAIKQKFINHSKEVIALMDSSKFETTAFFQVCPLAEADILITEEEPEAPLKRALLENNITITLA